MNLILFDDEHRSRFYPLIWTRPLSLLRLGIDTLADKWERLSGLKPSFIVPEYLSERFPFTSSEENFLVNSRLVPNIQLWESLRELPPGTGMMRDGNLLGAHVGTLERGKSLGKSIQHLIEYPGNLIWLNHLEDFIKNNANQILIDFEDFTKRQSSHSLSATNQVLGDRVYLNGSVKSEYAYFNTETGPIFLDEGVEIMEGAMIRGPVAILAGSVVKMGAKIYGGTSIGPHCVIGGEVKNANILGFSNKGHEGYLGDSMIGEWCNLGADTNNSNMKNNYGLVRLFDYSIGDFRLTDMKFLGVMMGDHVKCGINSTINTGTVFGLGVNWFGPVLSPCFVPDFSWADSGSISEYKLDKLMETAEKAMERRQILFTDLDRKILTRIFEQTKTYRN